MTFGRVIDLLFVNGSDRHRIGRSAGDRCDSRWLVAAVVVAVAVVVLAVAVVVLAVAVVVAVVAAVVVAVIVTGDSRWCCWRCWWSEGKQHGQFG